jgi:hemolysin activation/secretion protein
MPMECHFRAYATAWMAVLASGASAYAQPATDPAPPVPASVGLTNAPLVPTFQVQRYAVSGNSALDQATLDHVLRDATGTDVSLPQIRRALLKLREAYRERGYTKAAIHLPQQPLTDGVVRVSVIEGGSASRPQPPAARDLPSWTVPTYEVRHFEVRGNSVLSAEEIDRILSPAAGPGVNLEQVQNALSQLQGAYRERGYPHAVVSLPQQVLTDGTVTIQISEGTSLLADTTAFAARTNALPAAPPPPVRTFEVRRYEVAGNTLLKPEAIDQVFTNFTGTNVSLGQIQTALGELQLAYRERGYATVSVGLPQQQLTNATVKVQVTEGKLVDIRVTGNRYFSSNNVVRALPSLQTNTILNGRVFQRELDLANQNRDRQIYPTISPGPDPGTSALNLKVKDRLPLHGRLDVNNYSTPGTPDWRVNASVSYNNLWQREHQLGLSYGFTPEAFKPEGIVPDYFFNRPLVANYGAYYRLPFGTAGSVQEQIRNSAGQFGYDEATRQFRLPPAGGRPDLTFFGSESSSDTGVKLGPAKLVSQTPLLTIVSQDSGQNVTVNDALGTRVNVPLTLSDKRRFSFSGGVDFKHYVQESFNSNNFTITTVVTNAQGSQTIESQVSSPQPKRTFEANYLPLAFGADYSQGDASGTFYGNLNVNWNFVGDGRAFSAPTNSASENLTYGKVTLSLTREQKLIEQWSLLLRASGSTGTGPLINNEQFALGGLTSVRGYFEGDQYGDADWFGSVELRTPFVAADVPVWSGVAPVWLRGSLFVDGGQWFKMETRPGVPASGSLAGAGFGVSANLNNHLDLRIAVGWPLRSSVNTSAYDPRVYFSLGGQF